MKLKFDPHQQFQIDAINAVFDIQSINFSCLKNYIL